MADKYLIDELLSLNGQDFIKKSYNTFLLREADAEGLCQYNHFLENGFTKEMIIFILATSEEGTIKNVYINGFNIKRIELKYLLSEHGEKFIRNAYIAILGRTPDFEGLNTYLKLIANGELSKIEVLYAMRYSEEGNNLKVNVTGLKTKYIENKIKKMIYKIPIVGGICRFIRNLAHINANSKSLMNIEQRLIATEQRLIATEQRLIADVQQIIFANKTEQIIKQKKNTLSIGRTYKEYEDKMRGSRSEIIEKLKIYDGVIKQVKVNNGEKVCALDLGCGRGEWLELLQRDYNIFSVGVDSDESMLSDCIANDFNVIHADLVKYIKNAHSESFDMITMFQVAEHLSVSLLVEVLEECHRVLKPGGVIIVETPNPENMIVGTCNFYFDPTHVSKLPPELLNILVHSAGMKNSEIIRMHEYDAIDIEESDTEAVKQIASFFNNYSDYAVVAYKEG